ncbi:hypothetical protein SAMN05660991_02935 [Trujillonella endophytica]|uniref:Uncharacterized protein n=1 Tax=Trujillonella endophytica TaxID=673521 RepID=A0A1H8UIB4_9ACTN|nr:hypothetical protein SAMN05660991_02935 [Trujillella endophytica]
MTTWHCRECGLEVTRTARFGCCDGCRPDRSHSTQKRAQSVRDARRHREANEPPHYLT